MFAADFSLARADWLVNVEDTNHVWPALNWDSPALVVSDVSKAIQFYEKVFGFKPVFILPDERQEITFARMRYRGTYFVLTRDDDFTGVNSGMQPSEIFSSAFYIYVDDVERILLSAMTRGARILEASHIDSLGNHKARLMDIFGYIWDVATKA